MVNSEQKINTDYMCNHLGKDSWDKGKNYVERKWDCWKELNAVANNIVLLDEMWIKEIETSWRRDSTQRKCAEWSPKAFFPFPNELTV